MNSLFRFMILGLIALMSCQQPFQGLEIEQKEPESRVTPDTVWDVANVLYDVGSAVREHARGNHEAAREHWQDAAIDGAAALVPGVPAGAGAMRAGTRNSAARIGRLPQDIRVDPSPPASLSLDRPVSKSPTQNAAASAEAHSLHNAGWGDVRVNQQQVNAAGQRVGVNRPDIQATHPETNQRHYIEYDTSTSRRGPGHKQRLRANDPNGRVGLRKKN